MLLKVTSLNVDHLINLDHIVMIKQGEGGNCDFHLSNGTEIMVYAELEDIHRMIVQTKHLYEKMDSSIRFETHESNQKYQGKYSKE